MYTSTDFINPSLNENLFDGIIINSCISTSLFAWHPPFIIFNIGVGTDIEESFPEIFL